MTISYQKTKKGHVFTLSCCNTIACSAGSILFCFTWFWQWMVLAKHLLKQFLKSSERLFREMAKPLLVFHQITSVFSCRVGCHLISQSPPDSVSQKSVFFLSGFVSAKNILHAENTSLLFPPTGWSKKKWGESIETPSSYTAEITKF